MPPRYLAAPGDPAGPLLTRPSLGGEVAAIVVEHDQVVGLVTGRDLGRAVLRALLRGVPRRGPADGRHGPADGLSAREHAVL